MEILPDAAGAIDPKSRHRPRITRPFATRWELFPVCGQIGQLNPSA